LDRLPKAERAVRDRELGPHREPAPLQVEEEVPPGLRALAHAVDEADKLLLTFGRGAHDAQQALRGILEPGLNMDAVDPAVDVAFGREVALAPARVLLRPGLLEARDGGGREPGRVLAEQRDQRLLEVVGRDAFEVEDRDQHVEALRSASIGRQNRRGKANALGAFADTIAQPGAANGDRTDACHDLALGQMPMAHQPLAAISGELVGVAAEQGRDFGFNGLRQQRAGTVAQNLGQRIGKTSWMGEPENVSVGHGVSLLQWRSGGAQHPHDTPPYPFMPSPTFAHSSYPPQPDGYEEHDMWGRPLRWSTARIWALEAGGRDEPGGV